MCLDCTRTAQQEADSEKKTEVSSELENLQAEVQQAQDALARCREQQAYLQADFENFRRNVAKERAEWTVTTRINLIRDLLPVADNFDRAIQDLGGTAGLDEAVMARLEGVRLIHKELMSCFERWQVSVIEAKIFDPLIHEAVAQVPATDQYSAGSVVEVLQKGYRCQDKIVRPARVVVAQ
ncbi:MAG: Protein GrpE [candidate division TM6 bacterium GW2011_GWF2_43_17]|nr:MAG: Protein GrpE [candidate division TM6 bacterium GW2011_GWF2_43_17]